MKGVVIWAVTVCRSVMATYRELGRELGVPVVVTLQHWKGESGFDDLRGRTGFSESEFNDMDIVPVGEDRERGMRILTEHPGWVHVFSTYQTSPNARFLIHEAKERGCAVYIGSEAPCNMVYGVKRVLKKIYYRTALKRRVSQTVRDVRAFVNYSGNDDCIARIIGWPQDKIVPFGYFPPPIIGTRLVRRVTNKPFEILATGLLSAHRGVDVLMRALSVLSKRGVEYHATVTQDGPLLNQMVALARREGLPVDFPGFMPLERLHHAYQTCTVYVGAGRDEPWGMRLNDALNCGAPLVVSRGMGGVKMVDDYKCGLSFENNDPNDLADKLEMLYRDESLYLRCAENVLVAAKACSPQSMARRLAAILSR